MYEHLQSIHEKRFIFFFIRLVRKFLYRIMLFFYCGTMNGRHWNLPGWKRTIKYLFFRYLRFFSNFHSYVPCNKATRRIYIFQIFRHWEFHTEIPSIFLENWYSTNIYVRTYIKRSKYFPAIFFKATPMSNQSVNLSRQINFYYNIFILLENNYRNAWRKREKGWLLVQLA